MPHKLISPKNSQELLDCVKTICRTIGSIPVFHAFQRFVTPNFPPELKSVHDAIHNAVLDSIMFNARSLDEFFFSDAGRDDDMRVGHFAGCRLSFFLTDDERKTINKHLAHITTHRAHPDQVELDADDIARKALNHGRAFLVWVRTEGPELDEETYNFAVETIDFCRVALEQLPP